MIFEINCKFCKEIVGFVDLPDAWDIPDVICEKCYIKFGASK